MNPADLLRPPPVAGDWMQPANDAAAVVPAITDALDALLVKRADGGRASRVLLLAIIYFSDLDHGSLGLCVRY